MSGAPAGCCRSAAPLAGRAGGARRAREARAGEPGGGALAPAGAGAAAAGRARRATRPRPWSGAGSPLLGAGAAIARLAGSSAGRSLALPLAVAGPALAAWAVSSRRRRYRRAVERALPEVATAVADSLSAGRSLRASLPAAGRLARRARRRSSWPGSAPSWSSARRPAEAVGALAAADALRAVDAFAAALLSQRLAGGDLAGLLRRFADGAAERDRVAEDARSATAQARFTGLLVVAMPTGGALFAELLAAGVPRHAARLAAGSAVLLALAAALQVAGFVAIRRFSQVVE